LRFVGAAAPSFGPDGLIRTQGAQHQSNVCYALWPAIRSAELTDFRAAYRSGLPRRTAVVGLADVMEPTRRAALDWLSRGCAICFQDEGRLLPLARKIAGGHPLC
jgi:hypothetical protein